MTYGAAAQRAASGLPKVAKVTANDPVTLTENGDSWVLDNGIVKATILKSNGNMTTVYYHGIDIDHGIDIPIRPQRVLGADSCGHHHRKGDY